MCASRGYAQLHAQQKPGRCLCSELQGNAMATPLLRSAQSVVRALGGRMGSHAQAQVRVLHCECTASTASQSHLMEIHEYLCNPTYFHNKYIIN